MKKFEKDYAETLKYSGEYILEKDSFKFRKVKVRDCNGILNSGYEDLIGKEFDIKYSYDYESMICIEYKSEELWLEDGEYEFVNNLPEYIKDIASDKWIGKLNSTKEYYGTPLLDYDYEGKYVIKNSCGLNVKDVLEDSDGYYLATEEEYNQLKQKRIKDTKEEIKSKIESLQQELKALEKIKL